MNFSFDVQLIFHEIMERADRAATTLTKSNKLKPFGSKIIAGTLM